VTTYNDLVKAVLGGVPFNTTEYKSADTHPQLEAYGVFRHIPRIARGAYVLRGDRLRLSHLCIAVVEVGVVKRFGGQVKHGLEL
jgi:ATP-dependent DNA helicase HFM1/MER3